MYEKIIEQNWKKKKQRSRHSEKKIGSLSCFSFFKTLDEQEEYCGVFRQCGNC
jgi:hypothetical protein